jgi:hypothetical protein
VSSAELNGKHGSVVSFVIEKGRYAVQVEGTGELVYVRPACIKGMQRLRPPNLAQETQLLAAYQRKVPLRSRDLRGSLDDILATLDACQPTNSSSSSSSSGGGGGGGGGVGGGSPLLSSEQLIRYFHEVSPSHVGAVADILQEYTGREWELVGDLTAAYHRSPLEEVLSVSPPRRPRAVARSKQRRGTVRMEGGSPLESPMGDSSPQLEGSSPQSRARQVRTPEAGWLSSAVILATNTGRLKRDPLKRDSLKRDPTRYTPHRTRAVEPFLADGPSKNSSGPDGTDREAESRECMQCKQREGKGEGARSPAGAARVYRSATDGMAYCEACLRRLYGLQWREHAVGAAADHPSTLDQVPSTCTMQGVRRGPREQRGDLRGEPNRIDLIFEGMGFDGAPATRSAQV